MGEHGQAELPIDMVVDHKPVERLESQRRDGEVVRRALGELHQDHLQEAAKLHKMEASGQYREPKIHRIMEIYASRTTTAWVGSEPAQREWKTDEITPSEEAEWDRWAEDVMSNVTDDELAEAATLVPANSRNRVMACAVDFVRNRRRDPDYARKVLAGVAR